MEETSQLDDQKMQDKILSDQMVRMYQNTLDRLELKINNWKMRCDQNLHGLFTGLAFITFEEQKSSFKMVLAYF